MDLKQHLLRQMAFSHATFGPGRRTKGVIDHIRKELIEVEQSNGSAEEWIDVVILALEGLTRSLAFFTEDGARHPEYAVNRACELLLDKQRRNEARRWPDWRTMSADEAIEHDRSGDDGPARGTEETGGA